MTGSVTVDFTRRLRSGLLLLNDCSLPEHDIRIVVKTSDHAAVVFAVGALISLIFAMANDGINRGYDLTGFTDYYRVVQSQADLTDKSETHGKRKSEPTINKPRTCDCGKGGAVLL